MKNPIPVLLLLFLTGTLCSQTDTIQLTLSEVVRLAQDEAPDALLARTRLTNRDWFYQAFLSNYKPQIRLDGTLPEFNRAVDQVALPEGLTFFKRTDLFSSLDLRLSQNVAATGGRVFASTGLQRLDVFEGPSEGQQYVSTPVVVGFDQPLFAYNRLKWDRQIEPLRYEEASKAYVEEMEEVAFRTVELFFNVFTEQLNVEAARLNKANADTLFNISQGRFEVGRIAETELLQIELTAMNANANLAQAILNLQSSTERLRNFLGLTNPVIFTLAPPDELPEFAIDAEKALLYGREHRSEITGFERRLLESESEVARARADSGPTISVRGQVGLTQTSKELAGVYATPFEAYQRAAINLSIPVADWGAAKSQLKVAESNQELAAMSVEQERINLEQEILLNVRQFDLIRNQVDLAERAYEVALKREEITRKRYFIGKIGILDLNIALSEQETARRNYIQALRNFWLAYYDLRRMTLFDFERGAALGE